MSSPVGRHAAARQLTLSTLGGGFDFRSSSATKKRQVLESMFVACLRMSHVHASVFVCVCVDDQACLRVSLYT